MSVVVQKNYDISPFYGEQSARINKKLEKNFFPKNNADRKGPVPDLALLRLGYLAAYRNKNPFTKMQIQILKISARESVLTTWGLRIGVGVCVLTLVGTSYLGLAQDENDSTGKKVGLITVAAFVNLLATSLSFWATGFAPHNASNAFNDKQDMLLELEDIYDDLGHKLIDLFYSKDRKVSIDLAKNIDVEALKQMIARQIYSQQRARIIVSPLTAAIRYIISHESDTIDWPENTKFKCFILDRKNVYGQG
jgi:hypothetical protein